MGRLKERYNLKERAYIYGGGVLGLVAPILCTRYLLLHQIQPETALGELAAWGGTLLINASTMIIRPHVPVPGYTGGAGVVLGTLAAIESSKKRIKKQEILENSLSKI